MRRQLLAATATAALISAAAPSGPLRAAEAVLGDDARTDLAVTIYGNGLGLVSDGRKVELLSGPNGLRIEGLSPQLITDSLVADLVSGARVTAIEHAGSRANPREIMRANIGKPGHLIRVHPGTGADVSIPATLLGMEGGVIARIGERVVLNPEGRWAFDSLPAGYGAGHRVSLAVAGASAGADALNLRYLTGGLTWRAAYTAQWSEADGAIRLNSWAVVHNATGVDLPGAWVRLVAGQMHRVSPAPSPRPMARSMKAEGALMAADAPGGAPQRQALGGYHLYRLEAAVDLADGTSRQVPLTREIRVDAKREMISEGYPQAFGPTRNAAEPVHPVVRISFTTPNDDKAEPLPAGTVRLFGYDRQGEAQFLGEDRLADIPVGGEVTLDAGRAFDVTVSRSQTSFQRESRNVFESGHRLELHNGAKRAATVRVVESVPGDWTMIDSDRPHQRDGGRAVWNIDVPAGGDVVLNYRVRVRN